MTRPLSRLAAATMVLGLAMALVPGPVHAADFRFGSAIDAAQTERSITIAADTRWANVQHGESIRFVSGQAAFGWKFDGTRDAVDLALIAPAGFLARPFMVYVAPPPHGRRGN